MKKLLSILFFLQLLAPPTAMYAQVVTVTTASELYVAVAGATVSPITKIEVNATSLLLTQPITLPRQLHNKNLLRRLTIDFQGCALIAAAPMPYVIGRALPDSQKVADSIMQSQAFTILNCFIDCRSLATNGIVLRATFHDYIAWCTVVGAIGEGISERFGMNAYIFQCEVRSCGGTGIELRNGDWPGAALNNSGSNMASVNNSRVFPKQNQAACFASIASGNTGFYGNIVDFAAGQKPQRSYLIDNTGSTTCKQVSVARGWDETDVLNCHFDVIGNGGAIDLSYIYPQKGGTMVKASGGNYTQINIDKWGNILGKFQATLNNGVVWRFSNNAGSYDFSNASNWISNKLPISFYQEKFGADQSWQFYTPTNRTLKHNNRNILTAP